MRLQGELHEGITFLGPGEFETETIEDPALLPDEIRVRNLAAGVCGTDISIFQGGKGSADVTPPIVLGHEYAGRLWK